MCGLGVDKIMAHLGVEGGIQKYIQNPGYITIFRVEQTGQPILQWANSFLLGLVYISNSSSLPNQWLVLNLFHIETYFLFV